MNRRTAASWVLNPDPAVQIASIHIISQLTRETAILETGRDRVETTGLDGAFSTGKGRTVLGMDVEDIGCAEPELRRECVRDDGYVIDETSR